MFTVSFILLLIARCSPDEWRNPYPCDTEYDVLENRFTVSNTLWFSIGTLMQQGNQGRIRAVNNVVFPRFRCESIGYFNATGLWHLVVLHVDPHFVVHGQFR